MMMKMQLYTFLLSTLYILAKEEKKVFSREEEGKSEKKAFLRGMISLIQSPRLFKWEERIFHLGPRMNEKGRLLRVK